MIDESNVKDIFDYNAESGELSWKINASPNARRGDLIKYKDKDGYLIVRYKRKAYKAHRVIWLFVAGSWPTDTIDHINGIRDDNRRHNLRDVPYKVNLQNINNVRGRNRCVGVYYSNNTYLASLTRNGCYKYLGRYVDWFDAVCARKSYENRLKEEFK